MRSQSPLFGIVSVFIFLSGWLSASELLLLDGQVLRGPGVSFNGEGAVMMEDGKFEPRKITWNLISPEALSSKGRQLQLEFANRYLIEARTVTKTKPIRAKSIVDGLRPLAAKLDEQSLQAINWEETLAVVEKVAHPPKREILPAPTALVSPDSEIDLKRVEPTQENRHPKIEPSGKIKDIIENPKEHLYLLIFPMLVIVILIAIGFLSKQWAPDSDIPMIGHLFAGWPLILMFVGGAIGGVCGGAAFGVSVWMFKRYGVSIVTLFFSVLFGIGALIGYAIFAGVLVALIPGLAE